MEKRTKVWYDTGVERCLTDCSVLRTSTSPLPLRSVLNVCHWHTAPCPIFAYREAYASLLCLRSASVGAKRTSTGCSAPHVWRVPSSKALSCKHERLFDLLTLASYSIIYLYNWKESRCKFHYALQFHERRVMPMNTMEVLTLLLVVFTALT